MKVVEHRQTEHMLCDTIRIPVAAGAEVFGGTLAVWDVEKGGCVAASNRRHTIFVGVAVATMKATGRFAPGDAPMLSTQRRGQFLFDMAHPITNKDLLRRVYAVDDQTVALSDFGSDGPWVGNVVGIDDKGVWAEIDFAAREGRRD